MRALFFVALLCTIAVVAGGLNIALHAQVAPADKIVGSVITTNGMKIAFDQIKVVDVVEIFYPYSYDHFFETKWDLVLIEGWFPSIKQFILLARNHNSKCVILFICLDPTYPGLNIIETLDVDGYFSNSNASVEHLSKFAPTQFLLLAADENKMKPNGQTTQREYSAVYVGAGGPMLRYKPQLLSYLMDALPFGLRLHGSGWNDVRILDSMPSLGAASDCDSGEKGFSVQSQELMCTYMRLGHDPMLVELMDKAWQGTLAQDNIAEAYNSAEVVIAMTVETQASFGMINNRIFEALACGAVVISSPELAIMREFGDLILYATDQMDVRELRHLWRGPTANPLESTSVATRRVEVEFEEGSVFEVLVGSVSSHIRWVLDNPMLAQDIRAKARRSVLRAHTWSHRSLVMLQFYYRMKRSEISRSSVVTSPVDTAFDTVTIRQQSTRTLVLVSDAIAATDDFSYVIEPNLLQRSQEYRAKSHLMQATSIFTWSESQLMAAMLPWVRNIYNCNRTDLNSTEHIDADAIIEAVWLSRSLSVGLCGDNQEPNGFAPVDSAPYIYGLSLLDFDIILSVTTPYDPLDRLMRSIYSSDSPKENAWKSESARTSPHNDFFHLYNDKRHNQVRLSYLFGFDESLMKSYVSKLQWEFDKLVSKSCGEDHAYNRWVSQRFAMLYFSYFYDVIWYRSAFELQLLKDHTDAAISMYEELREVEKSRCGSGFVSTFDEKAWGRVSLDGYRLEHGFGEGFDVDSKFPRLELAGRGAGPDFEEKKGCDGVLVGVVVVCVFSHRQFCSVPLGNDRLGAALDYVHLPNMDVENIQYVLLGGLEQDWLNEIGDGVNVSSILIVERDNFEMMKDVSLILLCSQLIVYMHEGHSGSTHGDVLWPLVLAASHGVPVHLTYSNAHLMDVLSTSGDWTWDYLLNKGNSGFLRGVAFPASRNSQFLSVTSVPAVSVEFANVRLKRRVPILVEVFYGLYDLISSPNLNFTGGAEKSPPEDMFLPGLDGQLCISVNDQLVTCMLRRFKYIAIYQSNHAPNVSVSLCLRGNMLGDIIYQSKAVVFTDINSDIEDTKALKKEDLYDAARYYYSMNSIEEEEIFFVTL